MTEPAEDGVALRPLPSATTTPRRHVFLLAIALIAVTYVCHFLLSGSFGLYEDDYRSIAPWMGEPAARLVKFVARSWSTWPQGRPLNHSLPEILGWTGYRLGGLHAIYLLGFALLAINVLLVFQVGRRLHGTNAGFLAALLYILFPADTTREFLTHCGHVQMSMTFFLAGALLLLRSDRARWLAYPVAYLSLLSYETAYLLFILFPLTLARPNRQFLWRLGAHAVLCGVSMFSVILIRMAGGEGRMTRALGDSAGLIDRVLNSPLLGFRTSAGRYLSAIPDALVQPGPLGWTVFLLVAAVAALAAGMSFRPASSGAIPAAAGPMRFFLGSRGPTPLGFVTIYLATWLFSYVLTLVNYPPVYRTGRFTSVHLAAAFPASLCATQGWQLLADFLRRRGWAPLRWIAVAAFGVYGGLLGLFLLQVQRGYVESWREQRTFWRQVFALCPELQPGVTVIVGGKMPPPNPIILANNEQDVRLALGLFKPSGGLFRNLDRHRHVVLAMDATSAFLLRVDGGRLQWSTTDWNAALGWQPIDENNLILLRSDRGRLSRVDALDEPRLPKPLRTRVTLPPTRRFDRPETMSPLFRYLTQ